MADHFVHTGTHALRIPVIIERAWVCTTFNGEVVHEDIDFFCRYTGLHHFTCTAQNVSGHHARMTHALDDVGSLHTRLVSALHHTGIGVMRLCNVARHWPHRADHTRLNATFRTLVTPLVLTTTAAPAGVVRGGEHVGDCRHSATQATAETSGSAQPVYCCMRE